MTRTTGHFTAEDLEGLWEEEPGWGEEYCEDPPSEEMIAQVEVELGYRLPDSYVELMSMHNGGILRRIVCDVKIESDDGCEFLLTGMFPIGRTAGCSLLGECGWPFWRQEWGYPNIGIGIADTISAGHELIVLDYRECGPEGEPSVVHIDEEKDYAITPVASDFATFIRILEAQAGSLGHEPRPLDSIEAETGHAVALDTVSGALSSD